MEPATTVLTIYQLTERALRAISALAKYAQDTKHCTSNRHMLADETIVLLSLFQRLRDRLQPFSSEPHRFDSHHTVIEQFSQTLDEFSSTLGCGFVSGGAKPEPHSKETTSESGWSFSKSEVFALLERITRLQQYANTLLLGGQWSLIERLEVGQEAEPNARCKAEIESWLSPLQMGHVQTTVHACTESGSGNWFLSSPQVREWLHGEESLLWCYGIPGAGKTVIASIMIEFLHRRQADSKPNADVAFAFIYFHYNDPLQPVENILGAVLKQLVHSKPSLPSSLLEYYRKCREGDMPVSKDIITDVLQAVLVDYDQAFFVNDALDESIKEIRCEIIDILRHCPGNVRLLVISRRLDTMAEELDSFATMEIAAHKDDLELYIDSQIMRNSNLRRLVEKSEGLGNDIKAAVVGKSENMFLLSRLHIESLVSTAALSIGHVRKKLRTLPATLDAMYDDAMSRIEAQPAEHRAIAFKALAWVSHAFRSLSVAELQHALAIEPGDIYLDGERVIDGNSITALCSRLILIDHATNVVSLVHYTAKKYFRFVLARFFPEFHGSLTMSCATYLTIATLRNASVWKIACNYPLACYAARYIKEHARSRSEGFSETLMFDTLCKLLSNLIKCRPLISLLDAPNPTLTDFYGMQQNSGTDADDYQILKSFFQGLDRAQGNESSLLFSKSILSSIDDSINFQETQEDVNELARKITHKSEALYLIKAMKINAVLADPIIKLAAKLTVSEFTILELTVFEPQDFKSPLVFDKPIQHGFDVGQTYLHPTYSR